MEQSLVKHSIMPVSKRLDNQKVITNLIRDVLKDVHGITPRQIKNTQQQARRRFAREGEGFFTKTLPKLGKALDRALTGEAPIDCLRFRKVPGTQLPRFLGELFRLVFDSSGWVLPSACTRSVRSIREVLFVFYKLKLPYEATLEQSVVAEFWRTEQEVKNFNALLSITSHLPSQIPTNCHTDPDYFSRIGMYNWGQCPDQSSTASTIPAIKRWRRFDGTLQGWYRECVPNIRNLIVGGLSERTDYAVESCMWGMDTIVISNLDGQAPEEVHVAKFRHKNDHYATHSSQPRTPFKLERMIGVDLEEAVDRNDLMEGMKRQLARVLCNFDPLDISPKHGPGSVSTKEKYEEKYDFKRINPRLDSVFPFDQYFMVNSNHVSDTLADQTNQRVRTTCPALSDELGSDGIVVRESSAKIVLVPKDSRGPRLISCEPLENQWIQQGIMRRLVKHIESHPLTGGHVNFTDQSINQSLALAGSATGGLATLDLKEASDRVSMGLVARIFPPHIVRALAASRSLKTSSAEGEELELGKFAPMGSALCFPVMALTIWAALTAQCDVTSACRRETVFVYGDDVIVPGNNAQSAITRLELVGLKVNKDKSFTNGLFRESCGTDAFRGADVTPCRISTDWSSAPESAVYASHIAYANEMHRRGYHRTAQYIAACLVSRFTEVPFAYDEDSYQTLASRGILAIQVLPRHDDRCNTFDMVTIQSQSPYAKKAFRDRNRKAPRRMTSVGGLCTDAVMTFFENRGILDLGSAPTAWNLNTQKYESYVRAVSPPSHKGCAGFWSRLLRFFTESEGELRAPLPNGVDDRSTSDQLQQLFPTPVSTDTYTPKNKSKLEFTWR